MLILALIRRAGRPRGAPHWSRPCFLPKKRQARSLSGLPDPNVCSPRRVPSPGSLRRAAQDSFPLGKSSPSGLLEQSSKEMLLEELGTPRKQLSWFCFHSPLKADSWILLRGSTTWF